MANYIHSLQETVASLDAQITVMECMIRDFRAHLCSTKFQPSDSDPERRDWIAVADVDKRLQDILNAALVLESAR